MTLEEVLVELRELRWELQQQRWQDTATLARLWSGVRRWEDSRCEMSAQRARGRQIEALREVERLLRDGGKDD